MASLFPHADSRMAAELAILENLAKIVAEDAAKLTQQNTANSPANDPVRLAALKQAAENEKKFDQQAFMHSALSGSTRKGSPRRARRMAPPAPRPATGASDAGLKWEPVSVDTKLEATEATVTQLELHCCYGGVLRIKGVDLATPTTIWRPHYFITIPE